LVRPAALIVINCRNVAKLNFVGGEIFRTRPDRTWEPPSLLYNEHRVCFRGIKRGWRRGLALTTSTHIVPRLKKEYNYTSTPPLGLHSLF
jgi:hypothetical protein